jgi:hypothetical protein
MGKGLARWACACFQFDPLGPEVEGGYEKITRAGPRKEGSGALATGRRFGRYLKRLGAILGIWRLMGGWMFVTHCMDLEKQMPKSTA